MYFMLIELGVHEAMLGWDLMEVWIDGDDVEQGMSEVRREHVGD